MNLVLLWFCLTSLLIFNYRTAQRVILSIEKCLNVFNAYRRYKKKTLNRKIHRIGFFVMF